MGIFELNGRTELNGIRIRAVNKELGNSWKIGQQQRHGRNAAAQPRQQGRVILGHTPLRLQRSPHFFERQRAQGQNLAARQDRRQRKVCLLYTSPSPRDRTRSRMPSSA